MATINSGYKSFFDSMMDALEANAGTTSTTLLIDIDKAKQAFAASTLCQHTFFKPGTEVNREMLCAVSALVVYAGMTPELWGSLVTDGSTIWQFARPILQKHYNIPAYLTREIPAIFDRQPNEWKAVQAVLDLFETYNHSIIYEQALEEDRQRFPQQGCKESITTTMQPYQKQHYDWMVSQFDVSFFGKFDVSLFGPSLKDMGKYVDPLSVKPVPFYEPKSYMDMEAAAKAMAAKQRKLDKVAGLKSMWLSLAL